MHILLCKRHFWPPPPHTRASLLCSKLLNPSALFKIMANLVWEMLRFLSLICCRIMWVEYFPQRRSEVFWVKLVCGLGPVGTLTMKGGTTTICDRKNERAKEREWRSREGAVRPAASEKYTMVVLQKKDKVLLGLNNLWGNWPFSVQAFARYCQASNEIKEKVMPQKLAVN